MKAKTACAAAYSRCRGSSVAICPAVGAYCGRAYACCFRAWDGNDVGVSIRAAAAAAAAAGCNALHHAPRPKELEAALAHGRSGRIRVRARD